MKYLSFLILFAAAFFFRLWLVQYSPQPVVYDQQEYQVYALEWLQKGITAAWFRTYAYPLFLILIYKIAGVGNIYAVYTVQALFDTSTGFILFALAQLLWRRTSVSWMVLLFYSFNPFTSAYVGVLLTEVLAGFLLCLYLFIMIRGIRVIREIGEKRERRWFFVGGLVLGYLVQVRPAFLLWSVLSLVFWVWGIGVLEGDKGNRPKNFRGNFQGKRMVGYGVLAGIGYMIPFLYTIYTNLRFFHQFAPTTVIGFSQELYTGTFIKDFPPFLANAADYSPELPKVYGELFSQAATVEGRKAMQQSFLKRTIQQVLRDPGDYVLWRFQKIGRMWDREKLFFYIEKDYEKHKEVFLWWGRMIIILGGVGVIREIRVSRERDVRKLFALHTAGTLVFFTLLFSLTHAESRLTIPLLPLVIFYSGSTFLWRLNHG